MIGFGPLRNTLSDSELVSLVQLLSERQMRLHLPIEEVVSLSALEDGESEDDSEKGDCRISLPK